jgi:hypothetical protein
MCEWTAFHRPARAQTRFYETCTTLILAVMGTQLLRFLFCGYLAAFLKILPKQNDVRSMVEHPAEGPRVAEESRLLIPVDLFG